MSIYSQGKRLDGSSTIGSIVLYAGPNIPSGWLRCDGTLYQSRNSDGTLTPYDALYQVIGHKYGEGAQIGSFKVPDMSERFAEGSEDNTTLGVAREAGLPDHNHTFTGTTSAASSVPVNGTNVNNYDSNGNHYHLGGLKRIHDSLDGAYGTSASSSTVSYPVERYDRGSTYYDQDYTEYVSAHSHSITASGTINNASVQNAIYGKSTTVQPKALCLHYIIKYK